MDKKLVKALNDQVNNELFSAYLYLAMSAYLETINLGGAASWMKVQAKEELAHGMKIFDFLNDRGERVELAAIDKPIKEFSSVKGVFEAALKHEQKVTSAIDKLYGLAKKVGDNATEVFLQWYITEQVEEEKNARDILENLKTIKPGSSAMLMYDQVLRKRQ